MSDGQYSGNPAPHKTCFAIELSDFRGKEYVHSTNVRVDGGSLIFTNGSYPAPSELVTAYSAHSYLSVWPLDICSHEEGDE